MATADKSYRVLLPSDVLPERYDLQLEPDLEGFTFEGVVRITCDVRVATDVISLHGKELLIRSASFKSEADEGKDALPAVEINMKVKDMTVALVFEEVLPTGNGVLEISFRGILNDQMAGFYRSKMTDSKGVQRYLATTQFEAVDARRCFPCWDEPSRKAVFVVTLIYPGHLMAVSNMPPTGLLVLKDGRKKETFAPTPLMSTYLLAFCVGEFEYISGQTKDGVVARVMCTPGNTERCAYALKCTVKALDFYNGFFGIPYPLPKVDMIAIPDFSAGAMENWGLVTYREVLLLCDEKTVSATQKQRICSVITHELAHQWFGNLVTMGWWDDLWLNEGFANWMQTFAADKLHPEWNLWEAFVSTDQGNALKLDALRTSHPIQVPIGRAETVEEVFDAISYCKGGSVVRMIYAVLGEAKFQEGLGIYFQRHKYGNTETTDLWRAWAEASGKPIGDMMNSWTSQMGCPVLKVLKDPIEAGDTEVELEQSWFLADGSKQPGDESKLWFTPILAGSDKGAAPIVFLEQKKQKVSIGDFAKGAAYLKLNLGQHVPLRVLYPASMYTRFAACAQTLAAEDRIGLLSDTFALCKSGALDPGSLVRLLIGFTAETNDKVWSELSKIISELEKLVTQGLEAPTHPVFRAFAAKLVGPAFASVGWDAADGDSDNRKKLRSSLVGLMARYCASDPAVAGEAKKRFEAFCADPNDCAVLSADIRPAVLTLAMKGEGFEENYERLLKAHDVVTDAAVRINIYTTIGEAPSSALRTRTLEWMLTDAVRAQDMIYLPMAIATSGRDGAEAVFAFVQSEYDRIHARLGATSMMLFQNIVRISGAGFVSTEKAEAVKKFWEAKPIFKGVGKAVAQTVEGILTNAKFVDRLRTSELAQASFWSDAASKLGAKERI